METGNMGEYKTKDLAESGILVVKKQTLLRMEREGNVCWFVFKGKKECLQISGQFFFGELLVNGREYYETIQRLKSRIFSQ
ncbi:MAG: hypothetical protein WC489_00665 [Patescibacteria group bacterium]